MSAADQVRIVPVHERRQTIREADIPRLQADGKYQQHVSAAAGALAAACDRLAMIVPDTAKLLGPEGIRQLVLAYAYTNMPGADRDVVDELFEDANARTERISPNNPINVLPDGTLVVPPAATRRHFFEADEYRRSRTPPRPRGRPLKEKPAG